MDIFEFELRYKAYNGLNTIFNLWWDTKTLVNLVKITNKWILDKKLQEVTPEEIKNFTFQTYSKFKKNFIEQSKEKKLYPNLEEYNLAMYIDRLEYELKVIKEMWFNTYFLIVSDFVQRAKKNTIAVWPWRWSWAGSLLAWVVQITDIDPLPYGLLFERFLNPARISMPDFDIDFEDVQREKVVEYVRDKYWVEKVCSIWTFMKMATKAAFKDSARAMWVPFEKSNIFSALIPERTSINDALEEEGNEDLKNMYNNDEQIQNAVDIWTKLEWNMRQLWVHACGIIIAPEPVITYTAVQYAKENDHTIVSQYDGPTLETIGLLKMDFLWLRNLSIIKNCIKIIKVKHEKEWKELPKIFSYFFERGSFIPPVDDPSPYEQIFSTWDTSGIFQFESTWMRRFLVKLQPNSINDLVAMNALYRPWPMEFIPNYIDRKHGLEKVSYLSDELKTILTKKYWEETALEEGKKLEEDLSSILWLTYGIAVYQEQLMFIVQNMAWFSLAEADLLRRWVGKKKKAVIEQLKKEFTAKWSVFRNYKPETTTYIYEKMIEPAGSYSFNKSHSVCYAWIAYQTAYLKTHYPVEFYASLIRSVEEDTDEQAKYIYETQAHGIDVLPPDVSDSFNHVAAIWWNIRLWFLGIKGIGFDIGEAIQKERQSNWPFISLEDFLKRCDKSVNKKSLEWLIKSWALDKFEDRNTLLENINHLLERSKSSKTMDMWLFGWDDSTSKIVFQNRKETTLLQKLMLEQDVLKSFVSWHPLDGLYSYLKKGSFFSQIDQEKYIWPFKVTGIISNIQRAKKKGFFIEIEDISWKKEFFFKEIFDFKKFDIVIIYGFKQEWRMPNISKMIVTDRDILIKLAWRSYDENMTVVKAKELRNQAKEPKLEEREKPQKKEESIIQDDEFVNWEEEIIEESKIESIDQPLVFKLPDNIEVLKKIKDILNEYIGENKIILGNMEIETNEEWIEKLKTLLDK